MGSRAWRTSGIWHDARNVKGLTLQNVRLEYDEPDARPAVILDNVQDVTINGLSAKGSEGTELLRIINSKDILLTATRVLTPALAFLRVGGAKSNNIIVDGGALSNAGKPVVFENDAIKESVTLRV
jgi:hypothetical protein